MASIAEEVAANARAQAEGYANAAAKEAHANTQSQAAGFSNAVQQEIDANIRAQAAGFRNAAEQEMDANRRSREAGFTSAVDQEIDANRRARGAGFLNAADLETYGVGGATRSTDPFIDPRHSAVRQTTINPSVYNRAQQYSPRMPQRGSFYNPAQSNRWNPSPQRRLWGGYGGGFGGGYGGGMQSYRSNYQPQSLFNFSQYNPMSGGGSSYYRPNSRPSFGGGYGGGYGRPQNLWNYGRR